MKVASAHTHTGDLALKLMWVYMLHARNMSTSNTMIITHELTHAHKYTHTHSHKHIHTHTHINI